MGTVFDNDVRCVAVDNRNQLIELYAGLRTISVDRFISSDELTTNAIIIQEGT